MNCNLVPAPAIWLEKPGFCDISRGAAIAAPDAWRDEAELLAGWLKAAGAVCTAGAVAAVGVTGAARGAAGVPGSAIGAADADFHVVSTFSDLAAEPSNRPSISLVERSAAGSQEWYALEVSPSGICLAAASGAGVARGAASLAQLALSGRGCIPSCHIEDFPRFEWRGLMLDTARSYYSVGFIEKLIDILALHKLNSFHWHLTDDQAWRLELPFAPEVAARGSRRLDRRYNVPRWREGTYTRSDIARIVEYARVRHVTIVPEIETPGHVTALLASHPEFSCSGAVDPALSFEPEDRFGVFDDILCAGGEEVFDFLSKLVDELCLSFPGPYVHMGGDEAPKGRWLSCPRCRARMKSLGFEDGAGEPDPERLQGWFMGRIASMLAARGKLMIGWDEIMTGRGSKDTIVMAWRGPNLIAEGARAGYTIIACPQTKACYIDHKQSDDPDEPGHLGVCTIEDCYAFDPIPPGLNPDEEKRILGAQGNLWSELLYFGRQAEYMLYPRLCALSEVFWTPKEKQNLGDFLARMEVHERRLDAWRVNRRLSSL